MPITTQDYMTYEDSYKEFEQYFASGEPEVDKRAMAVGSQDVDGLRLSEFLLEQAKVFI